jgi:ADP-ribose pyrophosphatase
MNKKAQHAEDNIANPWKILSTKHIYDNNWISLSEHKVVSPGNVEGIYGVVHFKNIAIVILPIDDNDNVTLVGQYRFATGEYSWELPKGGGSLDEPVLESAQRELKEETGMIAGEWTMIHELHLSNSTTDEKAFVFVARKLKHGKSSPEHTEDLKVKTISFSELHRDVMQGQYRDALTVIAVLKAAEMMREKLL